MLRLSAMCLLFRLSFRITQYPFEITSIFIAVKTKEKKNTYTDISTKPTLEPPLAAIAFHRYLSAWTAKGTRLAGGLPANSKRVH